MLGRRLNKSSDCLFYNQHCEWPQARLSLSTSSACPCQNACRHVCPSCSTRYRYMPPFFLSYPSGSLTDPILRIRLSLAPSPVRPKALAGCLGTNSFTQCVRVMLTAACCFFRLTSVGYGTKGVSSTGELINNTAGDLRREIESPWCNRPAVVQRASPPVNPPGLADLSINMQQAPGRGPSTPHPQSISAEMQPIFTQAIWKKPPSPKSDDLCSRVQLFCVPRALSLWFPSCSM